MTTTLYIENIPPRARKGLILRLLIEVGRVEKADIGRIELADGVATVEITDSAPQRAAAHLDRHTINNRTLRVWAHQTSLQSEHFQQLTRWLALEAQAQREQAHSGNNLRPEQMLTKLVIRSEQIGIGGRPQITFGLRNREAQLPWSRLSSGTPVLILTPQQATGQAHSGLISQLSRHTVQVTFRRDPELNEADGPFIVRAQPDAVGRERMQRALSAAAAARGNQLAALRDVLLGDEAPRFQEIAPEHVRPFVEQLNASQQAAVAWGLAAEDVAIIHGPPGTGKTTTLVALIQAAVARGDKVLACAPSNLAVDNLAERLHAVGVNIVRVGHPIRVLPTIQKHTLDAQVEQHTDFKQARKLHKDAQALKRSSRKFKRARPEKGAKQAQRDEANEMIDDARELEALAIQRVLDNAQVVLSTLTAVDSATFGDQQFDLCVIDEAGQSTEPATWIPICRANKVVLAGDHQQLPPTVVSPIAADEGFNISLLERLAIQSDTPIARRLDVQYRMHETIMGFSSAEFYNNTLQADQTVASHQLDQLPSVNSNETTASPLLFIDTAGANYDEEQSAETSSRRNPQEAQLLIKKVNRLLDAGVSAEQIAVITPYSAQVDLLREVLPTGIEVGSVDGMQGREKEAVLISLVRSNEHGDIGFLAETRRINVALTRARRHLLVIGDSATITTHPFYARLIDYFDAQGAYRSVWEDPDAY